MGFVLGAAACTLFTKIATLSIGRANLNRNDRIITAIEIDASQRLHITYLA